jgi:pyruvate/2-oxoglutarate dehydrogenase complex dihydrolipoamide acyltransferase (E2) component
VGGIVERSAIESGQVVTRELLDLTVSVDHDVVDGAPAARFIRRLRETIEMRDGVELMSGSAEPARAGS